MKYIACKEFDSKVVLEGYSCITTMEELYIKGIDTHTTEIKIRPDFASEYFTRSGLTDFIENMKKINKNMTIASPSSEEGYILSQVKELRSMKSSAEIIYALEKNPKEFKKILNSLCDKYIQTQDETLEANNRVSSQHLKIVTLQKQLQNKTDIIEDITRHLHSVEDRLHILVSRINNQYGHNINMETMLDANGNRYDKVLYIKEITRVHYTDTFIYYLQEILRTLYSVPCRLCVMESYYARDNKVLYPDTVPSWNMTADDVFRSDIYMAGYQSTVMEQILNNSANTRYLIILDRVGGYDIHVHGNNVEPLFCVSDINDLGNFNQLDRIISYNKETQNILHIEDFDKKTSEEKMQLYSSMPIMKAVIDLMEGGNH